MHLVWSSLFGLLLQKVCITLPNRNCLVSPWTGCPRSTSRVAFVEVSRLLVFHHHLRATTIEIIKRSIGSYRILVAVEPDGHRTWLAHVALRVWRAAEISKLRGVFAAWRNALLIKTLGIHGAASVHGINFLDWWLALLPLSLLRLSFLSSFLVLVKKNLWHLIAV